MLNICVKSSQLKSSAMLIKMDGEFMSMVDELVRLADKDEELFMGIRWIDEQSKRLGVTFYEMFFMVLQRHVADEKAKEWLSGKNT